MSDISINKSFINVPEITSKAENINNKPTNDIKENTNLLSNTDTLKVSTKESKTPLQKHVSFFDQNNDGVIHVSETYKGLRDLHLGKALSAFGAVFINAGLGPSTGEKLSKLTVNVEHIAKAKHDSDTDVFDEKGNFSSSKFEELFAKYDLDKDNALSKEEFLNFRNRNKETTSGGIASKGEFDLLVKVAGKETKIDNKETKVITREQMEDFYKGSLFYKIAGKEIPSEK